MAADLLVSCASLTGFQTLSRTLGLDPLEQLREVGLPPSCLQQPQTWVSLTAVTRLLENASLASGRDDFGLLLSEQRRISNIGALAMLAREQPDCRHILQTLDRYSHLRVEALQMLIEENREVCTFQLDFTLPGAAAVRQGMDLLVGVLYRLIHDLLGDAWQPQVCFRHKAPRHVATHQRVFGDRLTFGAHINGFVFDAAQLELPVPNADEEFARLIEEQLVQQNNTSAPDIAARVRKLTWALVPTGNCSADRVAQHLGIDRRTVHRHLAAEGSNFSAILDDVREEQAKLLLHQRWRSLTDVANLLGFSSVSAFSRWFQRHFGVSASDWRRTHALPQESTATEVDLNPMRG